MNIRYYWWEESTEVKAVILRCFYNMNLQLTLYITFCLFKCETEGQILKKLPNYSAQMCRVFLTLT